MKLFACVMLGAMLLSGCSNPVPDLKSPCVGSEGSPCDRRAPEAQHAA